MNSGLRNDGGWRGVGNSRVEVRRCLGVKAEATKLPDQAHSWCSIGDVCLYRKTNKLINNRIN